MQETYIKLQISYEIQKIWGCNKCNPNDNKYLRYFYFVSLRFLNIRRKSPKDEECFIGFDLRNVCFDCKGTPF